MSTRAPPSDLATHSFASTDEFYAFLEQEHATVPGIYLKLAKKSSGIASISAAEAVEVALCFGWIDGRANRLDDNYWTVRYTPRRPKSIWSQKNVKTVARLIEQGKMRPAGQVAVEAAKSDGRWERAYAGPATIVVPHDLAAALAANPSADAVFAAMNKSERYSVLWRVETASPNARPKRIQALVQNLADGIKPGEPTKLIKSKTNKIAGKRTAGPEELASPQVKHESTGPERKPRREGLRRRL
jgi:uncharacterized protein YdeI (YjbR/CyaY-like superfamily)